MTKQPRLAAGRARALRIPTRGTTGPNRLRRMDNWIATRLADTLRNASDPLVIDLGFGQSPITAIELLTRLRPVRPDVTLLGLEIDAGRVAAAQSEPAAQLRGSASPVAVSNSPDVGPRSSGPRMCCGNTQNLPWQGHGRRCRPVSPTTA